MIAPITYIQQKSVPLPIGSIPQIIVSITPPENVIPTCAPRRFIAKNDNPAITAWNPQNNAGDKNKNVNSIGSVTPVTNDVSAAGIITAAAFLRFSLGAANIIAAPAAGKPNCMNANLPCINLPRFNPN